MRRRRTKPPPLPPELRHSLRKAVVFLRRGIITFQECRKAVEALTKVLR